MNGYIYHNIKEMFGNRASDNKMERDLYSRDLGPVPSLLIDSFFLALPRLIVRPKDTIEVSALMKKALSGRIPVTPRSGGSTVFFNSVPAKGGIVLDLNLLAGIADVNMASMTVTVKAATTWHDLEIYLNKRDLSCKTMPSSAPVATVGGWLCMKGYGIGSLKYGGLSSLVKSIKVVLPDGSVKRATHTSDPSIEVFAGSEGTLGIITEAELHIRPRTIMKHFLVHIPDYKYLAHVMKVFIDNDMKPYNMHFADNSYLNALKTLGYSHMDIGPGCILAIDYEGTSEELNCARSIVEKYMKDDASIILLPEQWAEKEWEERFKTIKIKRGGPSLLGGEISLPIEKLSKYLDEIRKMASMYGLDMFSYGHVSSPEQITVMTSFFSDERDAFKYIADFSLVKKIQDVGYNNNGRPYGIGLWNIPYIKRVFNEDELAELRRRKHQIDPFGILNPGKFHQTSFVMNSLSFHAGMEILAFVRKIFRKRW